MQIEYDLQKSEKNERERGLSFELVKGFHWYSAIIVPDVRFNYPEPRFTATGFLGRTQRLHVVCFTPIESGVRVISFRKANKREIKKYERERTLN
ncbi:BrnT family toxin [Lonepinella sp. BR2357]|uniref:BrnT family toxin n=1 Tax=Lonepinella sp. BR2357 TaxID=3434549 RepID=UPI003F6DF241